MEIRNHLLEEDGIEHRETPNRGGLITPRFLVFHYTSGGNAKSSVEWLCNPDAKASAHLVVARNGRVIQLAPFNIKTWHTGNSHWQGFAGLNSHSIGIEMDNAGILTEVGSTYRSWFQKEYPENEVVYARHKHDHEPSFWHAYTPEQIDRALELALLLVKEYGLKDILGHDDIAPGRKKDPGPAFPLANIRARVMGRSEEQDPMYEVAAQALNIRNGPGVEYETLSTPLAAGTKLALLESTDRWSRVEVQGQNDLEGWVFSKYIRPL
jgi:N-acetylmuramoyl-L-alanine amidase